MWRPTTIMIGRYRPIVHTSNPSSALQWNRAIMTDRHYARRHLGTSAVPTRRRRRRRGPRKGGSGTDTGSAVLRHGPRRPGPGAPEFDEPQTSVNRFTHSIPYDFTLFALKTFRYRFRTNKQLKFAQFNTIRVALVRKELGNFTNQKRLDCSLLTSFYSC